MAKKPTPAKAPTAPEPAPSSESAASIDELTPKERRYLLRVSRFLVNIVDKSTFARARQHGYSVDEHREGWRLYRVAMGENRTLDHHAPASGAKTVPNDVLQALDAFENRWFPRTRTIIRRFAKDDAGVALEAAFFKDLAQQPLGPSVVGSVSTFVKRIDELKTSKLEGAKAVRDVLTRRGLTDAALDEIRKLLVRAETPDTTADESPASPLDASARLIEQRDALSDLRAWREDWRSTLSSVFDHNTLLSLGLIASKGRKKADEGDGEDDEEEEPPA